MVKDDSPTPVTSKGTLLLVDDERTLRFSIGEWARGEGYVVLEATNGREALEAARRNDLDAVVLDLKLGEDDGLKVLKDLLDFDSQLPVVMLTGHGSVEHAVKAIHIGAND
ncbi:MAG: response regulator, partial [bacterium]